MTEKTKVIVLNSPNNPTGTVLSRDSLEAVKQAVAGKPVFLLCDQVYHNLVYGDCPDITAEPSLHSRILLCQSFSKTYAMTGWRIGYLISELTPRLVPLHAAQMACMPAFIQDACVTALETDVSPMLRELSARREMICRRLQDMGISFPRPEGAFYVFADVRKFGIPDETLCCRLIQEAGVAAVPGSCFGASGYLRLSYCCSPARLNAALDRMQRFFTAL